MDYGWNLTSTQEEWLFSGGFKGEVARNRNPAEMKSYKERLEKRIQQETQSKSSNSNLLPWIILGTIPALKVLEGICEMVKTQYLSNNLNFEYLSNWIRSFF